MRFILYVGQETAIARELAFNAGIDEVLSSPKWLRLVRRVDASQMSRKERHNLYLDSIYPATRKSYGVRKVFGTRSNPARSFAKEVPALVAINDSGLVEDLYPHDAGATYVTIADALAAHDTAMVALAVWLTTASAVQIWKLQYSARCAAHGCASIASSLVRAVDEQGHFEKQTELCSGHLKWLVCRRQVTDRRPPTVT